MDKDKENPNSQPAQRPLLSLRRRPRGSDEAGRRGQWMERARIFALPRESSPSHASSSSSCSSVPLRLPPLHLGQPKVRPKTVEHLRLPEVQVGQPQAAPQGSRSQALSLHGDRLPSLSPLPPLTPLRGLTPLPCLVSPRDTESRGTELGSAGEKGPQPCSPCPGQPSSPVPRVLLPPLRVAQEGTAPVSPSWQLLPLPPIPSGARAMEPDLKEVAAVKSSSQLFQGDSSSDLESSQVEEAIELSPGDSNSEPEMSPVEEAIAVTSGASRSDQELAPVHKAIEVVSGDSRSDKKLSPAPEAIEVAARDSTSEPELSSVEEALEVIPGDSLSYDELSFVQEDIDVISGDSTHEEELSPVAEDVMDVSEHSPTDEELSKVQDGIKVTSADSTIEEELSPVQEAILAISGDSPRDEELSKVEEVSEVGPEGSTSDWELSELGEAIKLFPGENNSDKESSQGDTNEDKELSPEDRKLDTQLRFGEDCNVEDMSQWEQDDIKQLSHWEEDEDKEMSQGEEHEDEELSQWEEHEDEELSRWDYDIQLTRMAVLGGMERDSGSPLDFPDLPQMSRHQKVLDWLEANFPNVYGAEEEENAAARHPPRVQRKRRQHNVEAKWQMLVKAMSPFASHDKVLSKGKHRGTQDVSRGEAAIEDNIWQRPSGLVGDEDPLEGPSCSRYVGASPALWSPLGTELAAAAPTRAAEEEEPLKPLALRGKKAAAPSVLSGERTTPGTPSSLRALFNTPASSQAQGYVNPSVSSGALSKALLELQAQRQRQEARGAWERWTAAVGGQREGSPSPAPHSPPSPRPAQLGAQALRGQPAAPRKRPSRFRRALRALRGLFRCPCLRPRPEE